MKCKQFLCLLITLIVSVNFLGCAKKYQLIVNATDGGSVSVTGGTYAAFTQIQITATPQPDYAFSGWYDGDNFLSDSSTYTFLMPKNDYTITAKFSLIHKYDVSVSSEGDGSVTVNDKTLSGEPYKLIADEILYLKATPDEGKDFEGWFIGDELVSENLEYEYKGIKENVNIQAKFCDMRYLLYVQAQYGKVLIDGTEATTKKYFVGETVALEFVVDENYVFSGWY